MKEKIYIIFKNNEEEYDDYSDWIIEIYKDKEKAENRFVELVKTNQYKKDRAIKSAKYNEDIGAYRIEEHEIENETNKVIDTNASSIEEDIKIIKEEFKDEYFGDMLWGELKPAVEHLLADYEKLQEEFKAVDSECNRLERKKVEQEKTINLMAEFIEDELTVDEFCTKEGCYADNYIDGHCEKCLNCIKQYFKNKAKEVISND